MKRMLPSPLAWLGCVVSAALLTLGFAIALAAGQEQIVLGGSNAVITSLSFFTFSLVGGVILTRRPGHWVGRLFLISGLTWGVLSLSEAYVQYTRVARVGSLPAEDVIISISTWADLAGIAVAPTLVLLVFPTGHLVSTKWRSVVALTLLATAAGIAGWTFAPGRLEDYPSVDNPFGITGTVGTVFTATKYAGWILLLAALIGSVASVIVRFRGARGDEREQIKWMMLAGVVLLAFLTFFGVTAARGDDRIAENLQGVALAAIPLAAAVAILKYRLYNVDVVVNRTLVYGSLTAILAAAYFGLVALFQAILAPVTEGSDLAVVASTLAVAALFRPARARIQRFIDRRFYRNRYDATKTLESFGMRLRDQVELPALRADLIGVVLETLQPAHASLWLRAGGDAK